MSATNSVVSGTGIQNQLLRENVTVTVTAKDSSGNFINTGGETFVVRVTSKCVAESIHLCSNSYYSPYQYIDGIMTDNNDGTYAYSYSMIYIGKEFANIQIYRQLFSSSIINDSRRGTNFIKCYNNSIIGNVYLLF